MRTNAVHHHLTAAPKRLPRNFLFFYFFIFSFFYFSPSWAQVGTWKNYLAYHDVQQIQAAGDDLFVLASNGLYQYNKQDQSITTYDKVGGLSDTHITHIRWCQQAKRLVAVYSNTNIDLIAPDGGITNVSDIYSKVITGDKTVNDVTISGQYAYLCCGFGIVKLDVKRAEVSESYMLGFAVKAVTLDATSIYAQASNGVWKGKLSTNLIDPSNWQTTTNYPSFTKDQSDYEDNIEIVKTLSPGGPKYNYLRFLRFINGKLYSCNGTLGSNFDPGLPAIVQVWDGNDWQIYQDDLENITGHRFMDFSSVAVDPADETHVFAGGRIGLYEYKDGLFVKEYSYDNSPLQSNATLDKLSKNYTQVQGMTYDANGNLWLLNSGSATTSLFEIKQDGTWVSHHKKEFMNTSSRSYDNMVNPIFDSRGNLWFTNNRFVEPALLFYQPSTDEAIAYTNFVNQDGTKLENVYGVSCAAEDLVGNVWIGTDVGLLMIEKDNIGKSASEMVFTQVKVPRNDGTNYADYLLNGVNITSIFIDNDNKKWIGTSGQGVYVIGSDNMTQIHHFTTENSGLLSDIIGSIVINETSGEVFIGTDNGLCSYMSGVTDIINEMTSEHVYAYPNPVKPGYTGSITITGMTDNADVKILSASGALIAEGRSNGRFFIWDGCDRKGQRVASGIYMVAIATSEGEKGVVCKIAIVN